MVEIKQGNGEQTHDLQLCTSSQQDYPCSKPVRGRSCARVWIRRSRPRVRADRFTPNYPCCDNAAGGEVCFSSRPRVRHTRLCLPGPNPLPPGGNATWQSSLDTSKVWAVVSDNGKASIPAGSDPSCPNSGSIPCLLLQSIGNQKGPTGGRLLANVTFILRLETKGGTAPTTACTVGQTQLVPYTADYYFYRADD